MSELRKHLARIGRMGGMKSRRTLDPDMARRMVAIREARRSAQAAVPSGSTIQDDTSAAAQAVQDTLWGRRSASEKLMQVAQMSRAVELLAIAGLRLRHPAYDDRELFLRRAEARLGTALASRIYR